MNKLVKRNFVIWTEKLFNILSLFFKREFTYVQTNKKNEVFSKFKVEKVNGLYHFSRHLIKGKEIIPIFFAVLSKDDVKGLMKTLMKASDISKDEL